MIVRILIWATLGLPVFALALEKPAYRVVEKLGDVEVRDYAPALVAEVEITGSFREAGNRAFRYLGGYISGNNVSDEKISMTAPVTQAPSGDGTYRVAFFMPSSYSRASLPLPADDAVVIREQPGRMFATIRYRGNWSESRYRQHLALLEAWLAESDRYESAGEPVWARYDPPFMPGFMRTNEILVPVSRLPE